MGDTAKPGMNTGAADLLAEGLALRERRRLKATIASFEAAGEADPALVDGWFWLAVTRDNRGQEADAVPAYRRALELGLTDIDSRAKAWTWLASSLSKTGDAHGALSALKEAEGLGGYTPQEEFERLRTAVRRRCART